jgi:hypothetical protein
VLSHLSGHGGWNLPPAGRQAVGREARPQGAHAAAEPFAADCTLGARARFDGARHCTWRAEPALESSRCFCNGQSWERGHRAGLLPSAEQWAPLGGRPCEQSPLRRRPLQWSFLVSQKRPSLLLPCAAGENLMDTGQLGHVDVAGKDTVALDRLPRSVARRLRPRQGSGFGAVGGLRIITEPPTLNSVLRWVADDGIRKKVQRARCAWSTPCRAPVEHRHQRLPSARLGSSPTEAGFGIGFRALVCIIWTSGTLQQAQPERALIAFRRHSLSLSIQRPSRAFLPALFHFFSNFFACCRSFPLSTQRPCRAACRHSDGHRNVYSDAHRNVYSS